uniref:Uncharacterized protein n=1 Tax=Parascaris univalens TaxID=6257 RepID=A0A915BKR2_PARUN
AVVGIFGMTSQYCGVNNGAMNCGTASSYFTMRGTGGSNYNRGGNYGRGAGGGGGGGGGAVSGYLGLSNSPGGGGAVSAYFAPTSGPGVEVPGVPTANENELMVEPAGADTKTAIPCDMSGFPTRTAAASFTGRGGGGGMTSTYFGPGAGGSNYAVNSGTAGGYCGRGFSRSATSRYLGVGGGAVGNGTTSGYLMPGGRGASYNYSRNSGPNRPGACYASEGGGGPTSVYFGAGGGGGGGGMASSYLPPGGPNAGGGGYNAPRRGGGGGGGGGATSCYFGPGGPPAPGNATTSVYCAPGGGGGSGYNRGGPPGYNSCSRSAGNAVSSYFGVNRNNPGGGPSGARSSYFNIR